MFNRHQSMPRGFGRSGRGGQPRYSRSLQPKRNNAQVSAGNIRQFIQQNEAKVASTPVVQHEIKHTFADFKLSDRLYQNIVRKGYQAPTPIQDQVIPVILEGKDVVGVANTGTGKSAAFLLPLIEQVIKEKHNRVLVIVPTRELALQLQAEALSFAQGLGINCVTVIGGSSMGPQIRAVRMPHNLVIGTPGRLKDLTDRRILRLEQYNKIVLDEVDRMLDMGFIGDIKYLLDKLAKNRQSLFFSATLESREEKVMQQFVRDYVKVMVKTSEANRNVTQEIIEVKSSNEKLGILKNIIDAHEVKKAIIFVRTKHMADRLANSLQKERYPVDALHGGKTQGQRIRILRAFREGKLDYLIATDVAARGLDIPDVSHSINYDAPANMQDYVHRIGRTGRAGNTGVAITLVER